MRALVVLAVVVAACAVACPPSTNGARPCNQDRDCFVGEVCSEGLCAPDDGALDAGVVDAGDRDAGSGVVDDHEQDPDAGFDDAGASDAGQDAGASRCPTFVDNFDATDPPVNAFGTDGCTFLIANGVFAADLPAGAVASCGITGPASDARNASLLAVIDDDLVEDGTQQFIQLGNASAQTSFALLAFPNGNVAARRSTTTNDDVFYAFLGPPPHTLELDFTATAVGVEHVAWVVDGVVAREGDFGDDLSDAFNGVEVEAFTAVSADPPPVRVDQYALFAQCQ